MEVDAPEATGGASSFVQPPEIMQPPADRPEASPSGSSSHFAEVAAPPDFDLAAYAGRYTGHTRARRLMFIAERCPQLAAEAYRLALADLKHGIDTAKYAMCAKKASDLLGADFAPDRTWIEETNRRVTATTERLEHELNVQKNSLNKDGIRTAFCALADHLHSSGSMGSAMKNYLRAKDYCTTSQHISALYLSIIKLSLDQHNLLHVNNYVVKIEHTAEVTDPLALGQLRVAAGLVSLEQKDFRSAAWKFIDVAPELGSLFSQAVSPMDIGMYGVLCGLATLPRQDLKPRLLDNPSFKGYLDAAPFIRELIRDFYGSSYRSCLERLEGLAALMRLDVYLHDKADALCKRIKEACIVQYCTPYETIRLESMAASFGVPLPELEKSIAELVSSGTMAARIDSRNATLHAKRAERRTDAYRKVLAAGEAYRREVRSGLLRMSCLEHDLVVKGRPSLGAPLPAGAGGGGGGGSSTGFARVQGGGGLDALAAAGMGSPVGAAAAAAAGDSARFVEQAGSLAFQSDDDEELEDAL